MPSELGQGRPQDWPDEMHALAAKIREATDAGAGETGRPRRGAGGSEKIVELTNRQRYKGVD